MKNDIQYFGFLAAVLFATAWLIPNHYPPWTSFYNEFPAILGLLALAMAVYLARQPVALPRPALFVFLMVVVPLLQYAAGLIGFRGDAVMASGFLTAFGLSIALGYSLTQSWRARYVDGLAWVMLVGAVGSVALGLHQWLGLSQLGVWLMDVPPGRVYANLAQPNNLATLFCLGLASALYLRERGQFGRVVLALLAMMLFAGVAMTRSRSALLIVILIAGWVLWGRRRFGLACSPVEVVVGISVFVLLWVGWATLSDWLYLSAEPTLVRLQTTLGGEVRLVLWQQMLDALSRQPLTGYGWGQVSAAQMAVVADYPPTSPLEYAHNFVLDMLVWNGWVLGGLILATIGWWGVTAIRKVNSPEAWFALLVVMVVGMHGMVEYPHAYLYFLLPVGLCVGVVSYQHGARALPVPRPAYALTIALAAGVTGWVVSDYLTIESDYRLMRFEAIGIERRAPDTVAPQVSLLTQQQEFIKFARMPAHEGMSETEIERMEKVVHRYPSPPALMRYALALGLNQQPERAALELKRLQRIHTVAGFEEVRVNWASLVAQYPQLAKVVLPLE